MKEILLQETVPEFVTDPRQLQNLSAELQLLTKDVADVLETHYPGWLWAVTPFESGGVIKVFSLRISGEFGYMIHTKNIQSDPQRKLAIDAGGEILERYGFRRGGYTRESMRGKMRDLRGNLIPDISDKDAREQRRVRDHAVTKAVEEGAIQLRTVDRKQSDGSVFREVHMKIGGDE